MGKMYDEHGEVLEFVGHEQTRTRGVLRTDGMGRWSIGPETLHSLLPDGIEEVQDGDDLDEEPEYVFLFNITAYRPTGEFREDDPHPEDA